MEILDVLDRKLSEIKNADFYLEVGFEQEEMITVMSKTNLRALKLKVRFPEDFKSSKNKQECFERVKESSDIYRVLEYFFVCNNVAKASIVQVFPRIMQ